MDIYQILSQSFLTLVLMILRKNVFNESQESQLYCYLKKFAHLQPLPHHLSKVWKKWWEMLKSENKLSSEGQIQVCA